METSRQLETHYPDTSSQNVTPVISQSSLPAVNTQTLNLYLLDRLFNMHERQEFCDLVFYVNGAKFFCHRIVVAAWSPFLYNQLMGQEVKKEFFKLQFEHLDVFASFVNYMYSGYINLEDSNLLHVLRLATSFQVEPLRLNCESVLRCNLHVGNIISTYSMACKYKLLALEEDTIAFLQMHLPDAVKEGGFLNQTAIHFNTFLSSGSVQKLKPEIKLFLIISWLCYNVVEREQYFVALLQHINWSEVANDFLTEISQTENFFTTNESSLYLLLQTLHASSISLGPYTEIFPELREKYFDLLGQVVKNSVLEVMHEVFFPIPITQISSPQEKPKPNKIHNKSLNKSVQTVILSELTEVQNSNTDFCDVANKYKTESISTNISAEQDSIVKCAKTKNKKNKKLNEMVSKRNDFEMNKRSELKVPPLKLQRSKIKSINQTQNVTQNKEEKISENIQENKIDEKLSNKNVSEKLALKNNQKQKPARNCKQKKLYKKVPVEKQSKGSTKEDECKKEDLESSNRESKPESITEEYIDEVCISSDEHSEDEQDDVNKGTNSSVRNLPKPTQTQLNKTLVRQLRKPKMTTCRRLGRPKRFGQQTKHRVCKECDYVAANDERMACHIEKVHTVGTMYTCSLCNYECKWNKNYYNHMRQHFTGPPFLCDQEGCKFQADRIQLLIQHRARHFGDRQFECQECGMRFLSKNNLLAHKKTHTGLRPFECKVCQRSFATKNTLSQHMVVHSDDRPYLCDTCGFSSKYQSHLIAHRRIHTGEVFHCQFPQCSYSTPKKSQLKGHMRAHLGIRRHVCSQCGKAFVEKSHLTRHERLHNSEKPHKCSQCDYQSTRRDKLREHQKKHDVEHSVFRSSKLKHHQRRNYTEWTPAQVTLDQNTAGDDVANSELMKIAQIVAGEHGYHRKIPPPSNESSAYLSHYANQNTSQLAQAQTNHQICMIKNAMVSPHEQLVSSNINTAAVTQSVNVSHINSGQISSGTEVQPAQHYIQQSGSHNMPVAMADIAGLVSMTTPSTSGVVTATNGQQMQQEYDSLGNFMTYL